jgi:hypothetical protein
MWNKHSNDLWLLEICLWLRSSYYSEVEAVMVEVTLNQFWGDTIQAESLKPA